MIILGLDLSLNCTGYSVISVENGELEILEMDIINNKGIPAAEIGRKLKRVAEKITDLCNKYTFDYIVKEASFNTGRIVSTQRTFETYGVILEKLYELGYEEIKEIAATTVKKYVGGNGKCSKEEVKKALDKYVGKQHYKTDDVSDAVAVVIAFIIRDLPHSVTTE